MCTERTKEITNKRVAVTGEDVFLLGLAHPKRAIAETK